MAYLASFSQPTIYGQGGESLGEQQPTPEASWVISMMHEGCIMGPFIDECMNWPFNFHKQYQECMNPGSIKGY